MVRVVLVFFLCCPLISQSQSNGEALFKANCAACHKIDKKSIGPSLRGVTKKYQKEWLIKWVSNSQKLIKEGDVLAKRLFEEGERIEMTAFPNLSREDIETILAYTDNAPKAKPKRVEIIPPTQIIVEPVDMVIPTNIAYVMLSIIGVILAILLYVLYDLLNNTLPSTVVNKGKKLSVKENLIRFLAKYAALIFSLMTLLSLILLYYAYNYIMSIGIDKGYRPIQPIHFSHKIHAGDNEIDCQYCHTLARRSKISGLPSLSTCMNCHKQISEYNGKTTEEYSKAFYDKEIQKLYEAVGWDEVNQKYMNKVKSVEWIRIHNLPDLAYFNHSQHVVVAGLDCKECHGSVEEMEVLEQYANLTMGWCVECHRTKKISLKTKGYYESLQKNSKYHEDSLTVSEMGGLECAKCHY